MPTWRPSWAAARRWWWKRSSASGRRPDTERRVAAGPFHPVRQLQFLEESERFAQVCGRRFVACPSLRDVAEDEVGACLLESRLGDSKGLERIRHAALRLGEIATHPGYLSEHTLGKATVAALSRIPGQAQSLQSQFPGPVGIPAAQVRLR